MQAYTASCRRHFCLAAQSAGDTFVWLRQADAQAARAAQQAEAAQAARDREAREAALAREAAHAAALEARLRRAEAARVRPWGMVRFCCSGYGATGCARGRAGGAPVARRGGQGARLGHGEGLLFRVC